MSHGIRTLELLLWLYATPMHSSLLQNHRLSAGKKAETVKVAQQSVDEFYENYNSKRGHCVSASNTSTHCLFASIVAVQLAFLLPPAGLL